MERIIRRWYDMISINSVNGHEVDIADYIAHELEGMGLIPHYSYFPEDENTHERPSLWTVLDSGRPGKTMMLIGHIDTVAVNRENWNTPPFVPTEIGDRVFGRGSMDMKGGLAAILETLEYYCSHRDEITGRILACFVADEEGLSKGTYQLVAEGITADYAIMAECRYDNVAVGFRGRYSFDITVHGKAAHASHYPEVGENALISGGRLAAAIEALPTLTHPQLKHGTWCIRSIEGGNKGTLIVPDRCYLFVDRYTVPGETDETCIQQMLDAAREIGLEGKVEIRLRPRSSPYMQSFAVPEDHLLVTTLQNNFLAVTGNELPCAYDASVCDSNILAVTLGIPTVTFGPSGGNMHGDNEYGYAYQVQNCAEIYRQTVRDMLN